MFAGLLTGIIVIVAVEGVSSRIYPPPSGLDPNDPDAFKSYVAQLPVGAFLFVLAGWTLGALAGSWLGRRIAEARAPVPGVIVGGALLVAAVANMLMLPHPIWFWVAALILIPAGTCAGVKLAR